MDGLIQDTKRQVFSLVVVCVPTPLALASFMHAYACRQTAVSDKNFIIPKDRNLIYPFVALCQKLVRTFNEAAGAGSTSRKNGGYVSLAVPDCRIAPFYGLMSHLSVSGSVSHAVLS